MSLHSRKWWLIYRDGTGKTCYENSGTDDPAEARKILAKRALRRAKAIVAQLRAIANGKEADPGNAETGSGARRAGTGRGVKKAGGNRSQASTGETR
jgi:hypothetical protein